MANEMSCIPQMHGKFCFFSKTRIDMYIKIELLCMLLNVQLSTLFYPTVNKKANVSEVLL